MADQKTAEKPSLEGQVEQLSKGFRDSMRCLTDEVEKIWAAKAHKFLMDTQLSLSGGEVVFPTMELFPKNERVLWLEKALPAFPKSTINTFNAWLHDGEFPITVGQTQTGRGNPSWTNYGITIYTNFARRVVLRHSENMFDCKGLYYEETKVSGPQYWHFIYPGIPGTNKRICKQSEDIPFPLTDQQCKALLLAVGRGDQPSYPASGSGPVHERLLERYAIYSDGGEMLVEELIALFRERTEQPLAYQIVRDRRALDADNKRLDVEWSKFELEKRLLAEQKAALEAEKSQFQARVQRLADSEKKQGAARSAMETRIANAIDLLRSSLDPPSVDVANYAMKDAISVLSGGSTS